MYSEARCRAINRRGTAQVVWVRKEHPEPTGSIFNLSLVGNMIQDILFAHDFSSSSERAFQYAVELARRTEATLHLMYVKEVSLGPMVKGDPSPIAGEEKLRQQLRGKLKEQCQDILNDRAAEGVGIQYHVERSGAVAPALVNHAKKIDAELVVIGTKGQRGLQGAFVGSVAREVLRTAPCPVLTARALTDEEPSTGGSVRRVVAPIDFSDPAREALRYAGRVASIYDVPIKLVHVVEPPKMPSVYEVESPKITGRKVKGRAERALKNWAQDLLQGSRDVTSVVHQGDPATVILDAAPSAEDLVVMATRGLSGLRRTMLGSVTESVVCEATGPVLAGRLFPTDS